MTHSAPLTPIRFLDLRSSHREVADDLDAAWRATVENSSFVGGPSVETFERQWAEYCGSSHALGVGNGTDALELVLTGLGVGPGDEVIVPANTFIATAEAVVAVGAVPHFVDVDERTLLATPETVSAGITPRTAAVLVVHLYGQAADVPGISAVARAAGIAVVEDAAQAHGALWEGRRTGSLADAACFSFYPGKNLGALGDGGAITTSDGALAGRLTSLADHGRARGSKYEHERAGRNSRLDALQAAFLSAKLPHLDRWNESRRRAHSTYLELLGDEPGLSVVRSDVRSTSVHHLEVVRVANRDAVREHMAQSGIETGVHYPVPCHLQTPYAHYPRADVPVVESAAGELLSVPIHPHLDRAQVERVSSALIDAAVATSAPHSAQRVIRPSSSL